MRGFEIRSWEPAVTMFTTGSDGYSPPGVTSTSIGS